MNDAMEKIKKEVERHNNTYPDEKVVFDYDTLAVLFTDVGVNHIDIFMGGATGNDDVLSVNVADYVEPTKSVTYCDHSLTLKERYEYRPSSELYITPYSDTVVIEIYQLRGDGRRIKIPDFQIPKIVGVTGDKEWAAIYNKIIHIGIAEFLTYREFGLTDEDRERYNLPKKEETKTAAVIEQDKMESLGALSDEEAKKIQAYEGLEAAGITLSKEQSSELAVLHAKAEKMDKLRAYRERTPEREKHQKEAMDERREFNMQQNQKWEESHKMSEEKHNRKLAELQTMKKQVEAMKQVKDLGISLDENQSKQMENNARFAELSEKAEKHKHEEGMAPEVREMIARYYDEQEKDGKSR